MNTKKCVNAFIKVCVAAVFLIAGLAVYHRASAQNTVIVCEADRNGRVCCWDTNQYGPNRPYICN